MTDQSLSRRAFLGHAAGVAAAALALPHIASAASTPEPAKSGPWQIGCYTRPWAGQDWRAAFETIAEAGYKHVGLMTTKAPGGLVISVATTIEEAKQVGEEAKKRGLGIPSVYGGDIPAAKSLEAGIEGLRKLIDNCAAAGATNLMMGGVGKPELQAVYYKAVAECCDYAAAGVVQPDEGIGPAGQGAALFPRQPRDDAGDLARLDLDFGLEDAQGGAGVMIGIGLAIRRELHRAAPGRQEADKARPASRTPPVHQHL